MWQRVFLGLAILVSLCACGSVDVAEETPTPPAPTAASAAPSATPSAVVLPSATPAPVEPSATLDSTALLPAPLYVLSNQSGSYQVWRLGRDGTTVEQITDEPESVQSYSVSPVDGAVVYVSDNMLLLVDAHGEQRTVLFAPPTVDATSSDSGALYKTTLLDPVWSPDGLTIAVRYGGLALVPRSGGEPTLIWPDLPETRSDVVDFFPLRELYGPVEWSPDGQRMLMAVNYMPEGGTLAVFDFSTTSVITLTSPDGMVCCDAHWTADGTAILYANSGFGMVPPGLWRADARTGSSKRLVPVAEAGPWTLVAAPLQRSDGAVLALVQQTDSEAVAAGEMPRALKLSRIAVDGSIQPLSDEEFDVVWATWLPDRSGMVAQDFTESAPLWLLRWESTTVELPLTGYHPLWGPQQP